MFFLYIHYIIWMAIHENLSEFVFISNHCTEFCVVTCWKCCMKKNISNNNWYKKKKKKKKQKKKKKKYIFFWGARILKDTPPVFVKLRFKISVSCFSSTCRYNTVHVPCGIPIQTSPVGLSLDGWGTRIK
jgi:hypothetical protein